MLAAFPDSLHDEVWGLEVHVRHPHRQQVVGPEHLGSHVVFHAEGALAGGNGVEIVNFHNVK